jgi:hypothetical protein
MKKNGGRKSRETVSLKRDSLLAVELDIFPDDKAIERKNYLLK